jgi:hypothetical protein
MHSHLALDEIMEFTLKMNYTTWFVACKQILKVRPNFACTRTTEFQTHIKKISRNCGVVPVADKKILLCQLKISMVGSIMFNMM